MNVKYHSDMKPLEQLSNVLHENMAEGKVGINQTIVYCKTHIFANNRLRSGHIRKFLY